MAALQQVIAFLLVAGIPVAHPMGHQSRDSSNPPTKSSEQRLELVTSGVTSDATGHHGAFRIYETPDGTRGTVSYSIFDTTQSAADQINRWLKLAQEITSREQIKDKDGQVTDDRILGVTPEGKRGQREFLIIRRVGRRCYLINSISITVAKQLEEEIKSNEALPAG